MSTTLDFLSDNEVRQINSLVDTLDKSTFDYLQIDIGDLKLTIGKGQAPGLPGAVGVSAVAHVAAPVAAPVAVIAPVAAPAAAPAPAQPAAAAPAASHAPLAAPPGALSITATTMGRFYSRPDPNAAPYVSVGSRVDAETTVGLIEVMKLFNAVPAGVSGVVSHICVDDAQVVEYGQVLFYVQPGEGAAK